MSIAEIQEQLDHFQPEPVEAEVPETLEEGLEEYREDFPNCDE